MSMTFDNHPAAMLGRILGGVAPAVTGIVHALRRRATIRRNRAALHALPDNVLKDIGVSRGDINYLTENSYPGRDARWELMNLADGRRGRRN